MRVLKFLATALFAAFAVLAGFIAAAVIATTAAAALVVRSIRRRAALPPSARHHRSIHSVPPTTRDVIDVSATEVS